MTTITAPPQRSVTGDAELAIAAANGDQAALAAIYHRYARRLHDFCAGMTRDHHAAADCVQDVFCTVAVELPKLREPDKLRPWLYAIARRAALRTLRERHREPVFGEVPDSAATGPGPFTTTARNELAQLINQVSDGLCERDRRVLDLAYRQGLSGAALADALGVSTESAKKLTQRLRDTVERSLGALLVARQHDCPQLAATLATSDGRFTVLMRKRIARHIESCADCGAYRAGVVTSAAILSGAILDRR